MELIRQAGDVSDIIGVIIRAKTKVKNSFHVIQPTKNTSGDIGQMVIINPTNRVRVLATVAYHLPRLLPVWLLFHGSHLDSVETTSTQIHSVLPKLGLPHTNSMGNFLFRLHTERLRSLVADMSTIINQSGTGALCN